MDKPVYCMRTDQAWPCLDQHGESIFVKIGDGDWQYIIFNYITTTPGQVAKYMDEQVDGADVYFAHDHVFIKSDKPIVMEAGSVYGVGIKWIHANGKEHKMKDEKCKRDHLVCDCCGAVGKDLPGMQVEGWKCSRCNNGRNK